MKSYRIEYQNHHTNKTWHIDVTANNSDEAFEIAYKHPARKTATDVSLSEIPTNIANWGIHFAYQDTIANKTYSDYMVIRAKSEQQARDHYNTHFKGKHYWFTSGKIEPDGKHIYGKILESYIAACPGYTVDATISENERKISI